MTPNPPPAFPAAGTRPPELRDLLYASRVPLLVFATGLPLIYSLPAAFGASEGDLLIRGVNTLGPLTLGANCVWAAVVTVRYYPIAILTAYVGFLAQSALFFGIGALVYVFGNQVTIASLAATRLAIGDVDLLRTNVLAAVGVSSALAGMLVVPRVLPAGRPRSPDPQDTFGLPTLALAFLLVGTALRYGLSLPYEFGATDFVLPGTLRSLENLMPLGLALIGYLAASRGGAWHVVYWLCLLPNLAVAVLQFSKTAVVINLLLPALGSYLAHRRLVRLGSWLCVAIAMFILMQPLTSFGRAEVATSGAGKKFVSLRERAEIVELYVAGKLETTSTDPERQGAWTRLAYNGPQAFAMALYDHGYPSPTLDNAWAIFIPRVLWPDKPVGIAPGEAFYETVTGRRGSFLGLSIYADSYWQGGWSVVVLVSALMGVLFGWLTQNSLRWLAASRFIYLPLILLAWQTSLLGPTKYIANGLIGPLPLYLGYAVIASVADQIGRARRSKTQCAPNPQPAGQAAVPWRYEG